MYFIVRLIPPIVIAISALVFPNALRRSPIFPSEADAIIGNSVKIKYLTTSPTSLKSFIIKCSNGLDNFEPFSEVGMSASTLLTVRFFGRIRKGKVTLHGKNAWAEVALPHYVRTEQKRAQVGNIEF